MFCGGLLLRYEARRWVPRSNKSPSKGHDERRVSTDRPRRSVDNGKEGKGSNLGKSDTKGYDASEFTVRRHDSEDEHQEVSGATRSPIQHATSSPASSSETTTSKVKTLLSPLISWPVRADLF